MPETIQSFVAKLQAEGVQVGEEQARTLVAEAEKKAQAIVAGAQDQAKKLLADAGVQAKTMHAKAEEDLGLAARDAALKLRDTLSRTLHGILAGEVKEGLASPDFVKQLIHDVAVEYAGADRAGAANVTINVSPALREQLGEWAVRELKKASQGAGGAGVDLKATLKQAGFEYTAGGGTVEVTVESVVETLKELVSASLREKLDAAVKGRKN